MAVSFPGGSGNYFKLDSALDTSGSTVFVKFRVPSVPGGEQIPLTIATRSGSTPYGNGEQLHAFVIEPDGGNFKISDLAYWENASGAIVSGIAPGTIVCLGIAMYTASGRPAVKFGVKPQGGSFASRLRNESWWSGVYYTWINATVWLGSSHGGSSGAAGLALDCIMYASAISADADMEQQMDAIGAEFPSPYWVTSMRGYASASLAAAKESGSASPSAWTIGGSVSVDNGYDGGGSTAPVLTGAPTLSRFDSLSASDTPTGLTVGTVRATSIALSWTPVEDADEYLIYGRKVATESEWELYQSVQGEDEDEIVITNLEPRVQYGFKIASVNSSGESAQSSEVTATTKNLRVRCRTKPSAAGVSGVSVVLWMSPDVGGIVGTKIDEKTGLTFEALPITDTDGKSVAIVYVEIDQVPEDVGELVDGDEVYGVAATSVKSTWIMDDCIVQEA
ncbi:MAG: fibronectin type III domain-containing protein [Steroidobacteraceae bacterium]|nr:fibronectin type III domain-containing protein [Steroidobacteraceae bacterium]